MPSVSVIIPTYNCARYISEAVESVLDQTYKNFEIIVVDDGSTDDTKEVISKYLYKYQEEINYFYQENMGPSAARNKGLRQAKGKYIAFLDADDIWYPEKLDQQIKILENNPSIGFVYCGCCFINEKGEIIHNYTRKNVSARGDILLDLFMDFFIITSSVVIRKSCFEKVGHFRENLIVGEDYELFLRVAYNYKAEVLEEELFQRRVLGNSLSRLDFKLDAKNDLKTLREFLKCHPGFFIEHRKAVLTRLSDYHFSFGYRCLENGNNALGFIQLAQSIRYKASLKAFRNLFLCVLPFEIRKKAKAIYKNRKVCQKSV